jgi:hypothetical protein
LAAHAPVHGFWLVRARRTSEFLLFRTSFVNHAIFGAGLGLAGYALGVLKG